VSTVLERRLAKVEAIVMPQPERNCTILFEPKADASDDQKAQYRELFAEAHAAGNRILVVRTEDPPSRPIEEDGYTIYGSAFEAELAMLAGQRSEKGRSDKLADVLASLSGNLLGPVKDPSKEVGFAY
jgi:hypothetical protein